MFSKMAVNLKCFVLIGLFCILILFPARASNAGSDALTCRYKFREYRIPDYNDYTCAWCYSYLFRNRGFVSSFKVPYLIAMVNGSSYSRGTFVTPDSNNLTSVNIICETLTSDECNRWKMCCQAAKDCCRDQIEHVPVVNNTCTRTWDGYGCWRDAEPDTNNYLSCPNFLQYSIPTRNAVKYCHVNGSWMLRNGSEWTDYTPCLDKKGLIESIYLSLGCNIASILLLVPAIGIFLIYRPLRKQHRIRLHICFFLSFILSDVTAILWDIVVTYDRLTNDNTSDTVLYTNGPGCKALSFFRIYCKSTNYVWMYCEGFYLHRLISNAFRPPKSLYPLYLAGWGIPLIYSVIYAALRASFDNESCWAKSFGHYEWIIYAPNLLCLVANLFFLCNILRVLVTQLQTHPNEPSNFRRALKATFVLIPLFGIQLFVTLYRIPTGTEAAKGYERFTTFIINSQGFFVALIFCFCNGEVSTHIKRTCTRWRVLRPGRNLPKIHTTATSCNISQHREESRDLKNGALLLEDTRDSYRGESQKIEMYEKKYGYLPLNDENHTIVAQM